MIKKNLFLFVLFWWGSLCTAHSQNVKNKPLYLDLSTGFSLVDNSFTNTWQPSQAGQLNLRLPFFSSQLEGGLRYTRFNGEAPSQEDSDFHSLFIHLGWNYPLRITSGYTIAPTVRIGNHFMLFDESVTFTNNSGSERFVTDRSESEFAYELALQNQIKLSKKWQLHAGISYNRTLTFFPFSVTYFTVGLTRSFPQPTWLKKFIQ